MVVNIVHTGRGFDNFKEHKKQYIYTKMYKSDFRQHYLHHTSLS